MKHKIDLLKIYSTDRKTNMCDVQRTRAQISKKLDTKILELSKGFNIYYD